MRCKILLHFNSIKVRLELVTVDTTFINHQFQFHKGTIRTRHDALEDNQLAYFNSIKVRLERSLSIKMSGISLKFQFHKGTIRTDD